MKKFVYIFIILLLISCQREIVQDTEENNSGIPINHFESEENNSINDVWEYISINKTIMMNSSMMNSSNLGVPNFYYVIGNFFQDVVYINGDLILLDCYTPKKHYPDADWTANVYNETKCHKLSEVLDWK